MRQIIYNLVANDTGPDLPVRFVGLDLRDYEFVYAYIRKSNGTRISKLMSKDVHDHEIAFVSWAATDLFPGRHEIEFELITEAGLKTTLPKKWPVILNVRRDIQ